MSFSELTLTEMQRTVRKSVSVHWHLFALQGVAMTILGIIAIIWPQISTVAVDLYVGWLFMVSGAVGLIALFFVPRGDHFSGHC